MSGPEATPGTGDGVPDEEQIFAAINITPLVDVVLVLLILFMVTGSAMVDAVREGRLDVTLPEAGSAATPQGEAASLVVGMAEDGRLFVRDRFVDEAELRALLEKTHAEAPGTAVIVDADGRLSHKDVVHVLDRVRAAGFPTVGLGAEGTKP